MQQAIGVSSPGFEGMDEAIERGTVGAGPAGRRHHAAAQLQHDLFPQGGILIDPIEQDRRKGVPAWDAIVESAVRRFRPIVLTAAAAVLAMIPLSRSVFWGPMAVAIMGGLVVATALTLLALPALYAAWFRVKKPAEASS